MPIFNRDYLFETEQTKNKKFRLKLIYYFVVSLLVLAFFPLAHNYYVSKLVESSKEKFFNKSPDLIAAFTGDQGRITRALELSREHPTSKLLISGVYSRNNLQILLKEHLNDKSSEEDLELDYFSRIIELDFVAQNTYENVKMTLEFLKKNKTYENVLIISSDYHLPRIHLILKTFEKSKSHFYFEAIPTENTLEYLKYIFWEHLKLLKLLITF